MKTSKEWCHYFESNEQNLIPIPWSENDTHDLELISGSIREFQKGESSEGHHLFSAARRFSNQVGDPHFLTATKFFIAEEQRHARELGKLLKLAKIPLANQTWPDTTFRFLRRLGGLEISIGVLVTAEIIAQTYYTALKKASSNRILRAICTQIEFDEEQHIHFQTGRLALLRRRRSPLYLRWVSWIHHVLFFATVFIVWFNHKTVFKRAQYDFRKFWQSCWHYFERAEKLMNPAVHFNSQLLPKGSFFEESHALVK
jgi:hypothetical protein